MISAKAPKCPLYVSGILHCFCYYNILGKASFIIKKTSLDQFCPEDFWCNFTLIFVTVRCRENKESLLVV